MADRKTGRAGTFPDGLSATAVLEAVPDPALVVDAETGGILAVNDAAGELFDCRTDALVGCGISEVAPAEGSGLQEPFERALEDGRNGPGKAQKTGP